MRRSPYALTVALMVAGVFVYACGDDAESPPGAEQNDAGDAGKDAKGPAKDGGESKEDSGGAKDSGADAEAGSPPVGHTVMVVRAGGPGGGVLTAAAAQVFIDEYEVAKNKLIRTITLPKTANGDQRAFVHTLLSKEEREGEISLSADGKYAIVAGYSKYYDGTEAGRPPASAPLDEHPRVVARVKADGTFDTATVLSDGLAPTAVGGATMSGNDVWITGTSNTKGPIEHVAFGNGALGGTTTGTQIVAPNAPHFAPRIFEGQLYAGRMGWTILKVGTGLPTTGDQATDELVKDFPVGAFQFELIDLDGQPGAERLYIAVDGSGGAGTPGGIRKYTYDKTESKWTFASTLVYDAMSGFRGLAAYKESADVILVGSTTKGDKLVRITDPATGSSSSNIIATAPEGGVFRGVTNAPKP